MNKLFISSLELAGKLRPEYPRSLGEKINFWENRVRKFIPYIPDIYTAIYNNVSGTKRNINKQELMDYIPGYRLIHVEELIEEKNFLDLILKNNYNNKNEFVVPLLTNYSNDFICYHKTGIEEEHICTLMHEQGSLILMNREPRKFFETICEFYKRGVYYLDDDGYLDYNIEKEGKIGMKINPGIEYWN